MGGCTPQIILGANYDSIIVERHMPEMNDVGVKNATEFLTTDLFSFLDTRPIVYWQVSADVLRF